MTDLEPRTVNAPMGTTREPAVIAPSGNPGESRPLFIPLKTEYFEAFKAGTKDTEYRRHGERWNEDVCKVGRPVVLSKGYGKSERLSGVITGFNILFLRSDDFVACYGSPGWAACIQIRVQDSITPDQ